VRSSAQGWFNLLILGLGDLAAKWLFIPLMEKYLPAGGPADYKSLFLIPAGLAVVATLLLLLFFRPPNFGPEKLEGGAATPH
jgi:hypothetical protein